MIDHTYTCKHCGRIKTKRIFPSALNYSNFDFCSSTCRNKARTLDNEIPCGVCSKPFKPSINRIKFCSHACASKAKIGTTKFNPKRDKIKRIVTRFYPTRGAEVLARRLGLTPTAVRVLANKLGVKINQDVYRQLVHGAASKYLTEHNPMKSQEVVDKLRQHYADRPEKQEQRLSRIAKGRQRVEKGKPTKLEIKMFAILDDLGVSYTPFPIIKTRFVVDAKVESLIIQADGEYWHGHPRFEPLTDRQIIQQKRDESQDKYLAACGYKVERIWEHDMSKHKMIEVLARHGIITRLPQERTDI